MPTDTAEEVGEFAQIGDRDHTVAAQQQRDPPHGCAVVLQPRIVADEEDEAEGVGEVDVPEFGGGGDDCRFWCRRSRPAFMPDTGTAPTRLQRADRILNLGVGGHQQVVPDAAGPHFAVTSI